MPNVWLIDTDGAIGAQLTDAEVTFVPTHAVDLPESRPDLAVIGTGVVAPLRLAQRIHSEHPTAGVVIVASPERDPQLRRQLRMTPSIPVDTSIATSDELAPVIRQAVDRAAARLGHKETTERILDRVASPFAPRRRALWSTDDYGSSSDIDTEMSRAAADEAQFRALFEQSTVGLAVLSEDAVILRSNQAMAEILGRSSDDLVGCQATDLMVGEGMSLEAATRVVMSGRVPEAGGELRVQRSDGSTGWATSTLVAMKELGDRKVLLQMVDTTARHHAELALVEAYTHERDTVQELRDLDRLKDGFLSVVGHELRSPLAVLSGSAATISANYDRLTREQFTRLLDSIVRNTDRLDRLTSDLLDLGRIEQGIMTPQPIPTEIERVVHAVVEHVELPDHILTVSCPSEHPALSIDPVWAERIMVNLLTNARRYTPAGTDLELVVSIDGDQLEIRLIDHGHGILEEDRACIFERFRQGSTGRSVGSGVGLALIGEFCDLHGGSAHVEDTPGGGATFVIRLAEMPAAAMAAHAS